MDSNNNNSNNFISLDRINNQNTFRPQVQQSQGGQQIDAGTLAAMLQQQQMQMHPQQHMMQMQPQRNINSSEQQSSVNISNEIKRLQQLHQMNSTGSSGNALLMQGGQRNTNDTSLLQSMLDQKTQNPRFDTSLSQGMVNGSVNQMLQPGFFQDARLLMAQNQLSSPNIMNQGLMQQQSDVPLPSPHSIFHRDGSRRMRGGVIEPFPEKLHRLLLEVEAAGRSDVISFIAGGRAFAIHKPDNFFKEIVPLYFRQSRLSSFKRQLNLYGFELINAGPARGGYFHELFVKDQPELCRRMRRVAVKVSSKQDRGDETSDTPDDIRVLGARKDGGEPLL